MSLPTAESPESGGRLRGIVMLLLRCGLAAGIIAYLVSHQPRELVAALRGIEPAWLVAAWLGYAGALLASAWRWHLLLRVQGVRLPFTGSCSLMMQGVFFSLVIPSAIGGDVVKAGLLAARVPAGGRLKGIFTILVDRIVGMTSLFAVAGVVGLLNLGFLRGLEGYLELVVYALLCGCLAGLAAVAILFFHRDLEKFRPVAAMQAWADRLTRGAVRHFTEALDAFRNAWPTLLGTFFIGVFLIHLPVGIGVWGLTRGLDAAPVAPSQVILATALGNTVGTIPVTPAGVGTRDWTIKCLLEAAGMSRSAALATAIAYTAIILACNLCGGLCFIYGRRHPPVAENRPPVAGNPPLVAGNPKSEILNQAAESFRI